MSVEAMSWAMNVDHDDMTTTRRMVLVGIANHDGDGGAWPSLSTLARYACIDPRSVRRTIRELERMGLVTTHRNAGGTVDSRPDRRPNRYTLNRYLNLYPQDLQRGDTGVLPSPERGDTSARYGGTLVSPEPSYNRPCSSKRDSLPSATPDAQCSHRWKAIDGTCPVCLGAST